MPTLRLLTYNIRSLRDDGAAVARVIRSAEPHVVCIQEAPRFLRWRSRCAALARRSGMVVLGGGRPAAANLLFCSLGVEVRAVRDVLLTPERGLHQRGAAFALLSLHGTRFAVAGTHLDLAEPPRVRHVAELHRAFEDFIAQGAAGRTEEPVVSIIAGDINDRPDSVSWQALSAVRPDAYASAAAGEPGGETAGHTYSATHPVRRIDGVFADRRLPVRAARVLDSADVRVASDHRPLLVEFDLN